MNNNKEIPKVNKKENGAKSIEDFKNWDILIDRIREVKDLGLVSIERNKETNEVTLVIEGEGANLSYVYTTFDELYGAAKDFEVDLGGIELGEEVMKVEEITKKESKEEKVERNLQTIVKRLGYRKVDGFEVKITVDKIVSKTVTLDGKDLTVSGVKGSERDEQINISVLGREKGIQIKVPKNFERVNFDKELYLERYKGDGDFYVIKNKEESVKEEIRPVEVIPEVEEKESIETLAEGVNRILGVEEGEATRLKNKKAILESMDAIFGANAAEEIEKKALLEEQERLQKNEKLRIEFCGASFTILKGILEGKKFKDKDGNEKGILRLNLDDNLKGNVTPDNLGMVFMTKDTLTGRIDRVRITDKPSLLEVLGEINGGIKSQEAKKEEILPESTMDVCAPIRLIAP